MDSDPILTREEIDALLSAIRGPELPEPAVQAWDFRHPRRLLETQLARLRDLHAPLLDGVARALKKFLNAPVQARLLDPEESTFAELLEGRPTDSRIARAGDVLIDPSPPVAFALVERALGAGRLTRPPDRPLRDLEADLVSPAMEAILEALAPAWAPVPSAPLRWGLASDLAGEPWPEGSCAVIAVEILGEGLLGDILVAVPAARFEPAVARPAGPEPSPATGVAIEVAARFPFGALRWGDLRDLAPGDLLVWTGVASPEVTLEVSKRPKFSARPGTLSGKAAVDVTKPAGPEPAPASLTRIPGGGAPAGARDVPLEIRAVIAERSMSLQDLGTLRPGARIEFPDAANRPAELRLGRRLLGRGPVVRAGDRLAVRIDAEPPRRGL